MFKSVWMFLMFIIKFLSLAGFTFLFCFLSNESDFYFNPLVFRIVIGLNVGEGVIYDIFYYLLFTTNKVKVLHSNEIEPIKPQDCFRIIMGTVISVMIFFVSLEKMEQYYPLLILYHFWQGWFEGHHLTDYQTSFSHNILSIVVLVITTTKFKLLFWGFSRSMPISFNILKYTLYYLTNHKTETIQY